MFIQRLKQVATRFIHTASTFTIKTDVIEGCNMEAETANTKKSYLYFAYGSNMNPERMKNRGVSFTRRVLADLPGYEFVLNKKVKNGTAAWAAANIRPKQGCCVYGNLYTCLEDVFEKLDIYEGVSSGAYSRKYFKVNVEGKEILAQAYIATGASCDDNIKSVDKDYLNHVLCGRDLLPSEYVRFLETFASWCEA